VDEVGVVIEEDKQVFVAATGWNRKVPCLVSVYLA